MKSKENLFCENDSEFYESKVSEIFVEYEIDCSSFVKSVDEPKRNLISENLVEFQKIVENQGLKKLKEQAVVFPKVQSTPNQVFVKNGQDKDDTPKLTFVKTDNSNLFKNYFWSKPIDNGDETKGLSEKTSWKTTECYIRTIE